MLRNETVRVAMEALWSNKLRAFLTTLGVVIGSACIVLVVTVALTGRQYVIGQIEGVGSNLVYANYEVNPQQAVVKSDEITHCRHVRRESQLTQRHGGGGNSRNRGDRGDRGNRAQRGPGGSDGEASRRSVTCLILKGRFLDSKTYSRAASRA